MSKKIGRDHAYRCDKLPAERNRPGESGFLFVRAEGVLKKIH